MNILPVLDETLMPLFGKRDKIIPLIKKWPIYELDINDKKGFWTNFKQKLNQLDERKILSSPSLDDVEKFYYQNPDIEFELFYTDDIVKKNFLFKINDKIFSYAIGKKNKRSKKLFYIRFFFDLKEYFNY